MTAPPLDTDIDPTPIIRLLSARGYEVWRVFAVLESVRQFASVRCSAAIRSEDDREAVEALLPWSETYPEDADAR